MLVSDLQLTDEAATVRAALTGEADAFAALFRHFHPSICAYAYRLCLCASVPQVPAAHHL